MTIQKLFQQYGMGRFGKHFRVKHQEWNDEYYFEPALLDRLEHEIHGMFSDGTIQRHEFKRDGWIICRKMKELQAAIVLNNKQPMKTFELFETEDEARRYCIKNKLKYLALDSEKIKIDEELFS